MRSFFVFFFFGGGGGGGEGKGGGLVYFFEQLVAVYCKVCIHLNVVIFNIFNSGLGSPLIRFCRFLVRLPCTKE